MYINVPVKVAAKFLDISQKNVYEQLKQGVCPYGTAVQTDTGSWMFNIPVDRLLAYASGTDISLLNNLIKNLEKKQEL